MNSLITKPIQNLEDILTLINNGYILKGPRNDQEKDLKIFEAFLKKGKEFAPEPMLVELGFRLVEPNQFTNGFWIAFKMVNDFPDERYNSNYTLLKDDQEIKLYLQKEMPDLS